MSVPALPPLAPGAIPPQVSAAGPAAVERFRTALSFERVLLSKLLSEAMPEGEADEPRAATLPETVADSIVSGGGAGIAAELCGSPPPAA